MLEISKKQANKRYENLPEILQDALFSMANIDQVYRICKLNHLSDEKIPIVARLTGRVILGFTHPEDLAREIKEELGINPEIAKTIALEIDRKIFAAIKNDLEKVYAPPSEEFEKEEILDLRTKIAIKPEEPALAEAPKIISPEEKKEVAQAEPTHGEPVEPVLGEPVEPLIIHKEAEFKPLAGTKKSLGGLFDFLRKGKQEKPEITTPVKAKIELGGQVEIQPPKIAKTEPAKVRVVHYTEFEEPISPFPEVEADKRGFQNIVEADLRGKIKEENKKEEAKEKVKMEKIEIKSAAISPSITPKPSPSIPQPLQGRPEQSRGAAMLRPNPSTTLRPSQIEPAGVSRVEPPVKRLNEPPENLPITNVSTPSGSAASSAPGLAPTNKPKPSVTGPSILQPFQGRPEQTREAATLRPSLSTTFRPSQVESPAKSRAESPGQAKPPVTNQAEPPSSPPQTITEKKEEQKIETPPPKEKPPEKVSGGPTLDLRQIPAESKPVPKKNEEGKEIIDLNIFK